MRKVRLMDLGDAWRDFDVAEAGIDTSIPPTGKVQWLWRPSEGNLGGGAGNPVAMAVYEAEPCPAFDFTMEYDELQIFLEGEGVIAKCTIAGQEPIEVRAGHAIYLPRDVEITWQYMAPNKSIFVLFW